MNKEIGDMISKKMQEKEMNQRMLAYAAGISEVSMSRYIKGERTPKGIILANIAKALDTTTEELMGTSTFEEDYATIQRLIARNAKKMTSQQKADLVNSIIVDGETHEA